MFYLHNKPTLEESMTIWKMTADAFAVSTDGGKTWNAGLDSEGNAVVNVLSAIGIQFDWARGGVLSLGGDNNINGQINIFDKNNVLCGRIDNDGIYIFSPGTSRYVIISPTTGFRYHTSGGTYLGAFFSTTVQFTPNEVERTVSPGIYGTTEDGINYPTQTGPIKTMQIGYFQDNDTASSTYQANSTSLPGGGSIVTSYTYTYTASHSNVSFPCSSSAFDRYGLYRNAYNVNHQNINSSNKCSLLHHMSIEIPDDFKYATDIDVQIDVTWNNPYLSGEYADKILGLKFTANKDAYLPSCANGVRYVHDYTIQNLAPEAMSWLTYGPRASIPTDITSGSVQKPSNYAKSEAAKQEDDVRFQVIRASDANLPEILPSTYPVNTEYSYNFSADNATLELDIGISANIYSSVLGTGYIDLTECFQIYVGLSA